MRIFALLTALVLSAVHADGLRTIGIPGQTWNCSGDDQYFIFIPPKPVGQGCPAVLPSYVTGCTSSIGVGGTFVWPTTDFTIWATNYSVSTDDPKADSMAGLLGDGGDGLTPDFFGRGYVRQVEPSPGRTFHVATDRIDFHVKCAVGNYAAINGQIEFTAP